MLIWDRIWGGFWLGTPLLILGTLWEGAKTQAFLEVDDDQEYGRKLVESLLKATSPLPGRAIGAATQHAYSYLNGPVMEGVHGVLFPRKFFDSSVFDYAGFSEYCKLHDDLWLSAHLARKGRRREALTSRFGAKPLSFGFRSDALFQGGAGTDNHWNFFACMSSLMENMPTLWDPEERASSLCSFLQLPTSYGLASRGSS